MRRLFALVIALLAGPLTWLIQAVLRPAAFGHPRLLWMLGPAPDVVVGLRFPFRRAGMSVRFDRTRLAGDRGPTIVAAENGSL
jgi:hypothetical protein